MGVKGSKLRRILVVGGGIEAESVVRRRRRRGYIPISVGVNNETTKRFLVHRKALCDEDFLELLCRSAEEYGFENQGVLRIPYEPKAFEERMQLLQGKAL